MSVPAPADRADLFSVRLGLPPASLLKFPPNPRPATLPPPPAPLENSWLQPFNISPELYNRLLEPSVPITVAILYATTVVLLNRLNKARGNKPWPISKTRPFKLFVILHNVVLAIYSAWTFVGMVRAFHSSMPNLMEVEPGSRLVNIVDAMCKINGPRGLGNAAIYNTQADRWTMLNPEYHLTSDMTPDKTDVGRLWNGGLAFFGWLFYLSKFYEVLDTVIILAKGKRSSTLQTYHHTGAMMCMWAGMRYMSAPIWIFTIFNSLIHAMMYTYYTLTALSVRVPVAIKRSLTSVQITQFILGFSLASIHLFIYYTVPVSVPHAVALGPMASATSAFSAATGTGAVGGVGPWLKKLALRAAGIEGVAENVANANGSLFGADGAQALQATLNHRDIRYTVEPRTFTCLDTTGQGFALWLNVIYLLPLTFLFVRFFVRSYLRRADPGAKHAAQAHTSAAEKAGMDALKGVSREIRHSLIAMHGEGTTTASDPSTDVDSSPSTPHPDAYEGNIDLVMTPKQLKVEKRTAETTTPQQQQPVGVRAATTNSAQVTSTGTPVNERAYEANVEDTMSKKEEDIDEKMHEPARRPSHVAPLPSSKDHISTPQDERGYEASVEEVMTDDQKHVEEEPEDSAAPKVVGEEQEQEQEQEQEASGSASGSGGGSGATSKKKKAKKGKR